MRWGVLLAVWLGGHGAGAAPRQGMEARLRTGDLVFHTSGSRQSKAIQVATHSPLSHVGLVEVTPQGAFVVEAVQPVKRTLFAKWKARGQKGKVLVLRPRDLSDEQRQRAVTEAKRHLGKPYDWRFGWSDDAMYCSELVRKAYAAGASVEYGTMEKLGSLDVTAVKQELSLRYVGLVPMDLELVTPASLSKDTRLEVVYSDFPAVR
jgi:hypothetical protein